MIRWSNKAGKWYEKVQDLLFELDDDRLLDAWEKWERAQGIVSIDMTGKSVDKAEELTDLIEKSGTEAITLVGYAPEVMVAAPLAIVGTAAKQVVNRFLKEYSKVKI